MSFKTQLYIDGKFVDAVKGGKFPTFNPATGKLEFCTRCALTNNYLKS
jgi:acyl-CoA reductase-like NAD-dependent aldehyde dehydrogenase